MWSCTSEYCYNCQSKKRKNQVLPRVLTDTSGPSKHPYFLTYRRGVIHSWLQIYYNFQEIPLLLLFIQMAFKFLCKLFFLYFLQWNFKKSFSSHLYISELDYRHLLKFCKSDLLHGANPYSSNIHHTQNCNKLLCCHIQIIFMCSPWIGK